MQKTTNGTDQIPRAPEWAKGSGHSSGKAVMASSSDAPLGLESHPKMDIDDAPSLVGTSKNSMFRTGKVLCFVLVLLERQYWQRKECINRLFKIF